MGDFVKVFVYVPTKALTRKKDGKYFVNPVKQILEVINKYSSKGVGVIGNYDNCSWSCKGLGRFRAIPGTTANPTIGELGKLEEVEEELIIFTAPKKVLNELLKDIIENHPYETPVIDIFELYEHEIIKSLMKGL